MGKIKENKFLYLERKAVPPFVGKFLGLEKMSFIINTKIEVFHNTEDGIFGCF